MGVVIVTEKNTSMGKHKISASSKNFWIYSSYILDSRM